MIKLTTDCCGCCALRFKDGNTSEYAQQPAFSATSVFINNFSVEAWINPQAPLAIPNYTMPIVTLNQFGNSVSNIWDLSLVEISGELKIIFTVGAGIDITADCDLQLGEWYHVVANRIGLAPNDWEIYVNGYKQDVYGYGNQFNTVVEFIGLPSNLFSITYGNFNDGVTNHYFRGAIAQVRIYDKPLTAMETQYNFRHGFYEATNQENLILWAPFNNCEGIYTTTMTRADDPFNTITLNNFGARTSLGGGAWISDCPCENTCPVNEERDTLLFKKTDELYYPLPPFPDKFLSDLQFCENCVPDLDAGTTERYLVDEVNFTFALNQVGLNAKFRMVFICANSELFSFEVNRSDFPLTIQGSFDFWSEIVNKINTESGLGMYCILENGQFKVSARSGNIDCLCMSSLIVRSVDSLDELEYTPPQNKRFFNGLCGETFTLPYTSFMVITAYDMCIYKIQDIQCVEGKRLKIKIPENSSIDSNCNWKLCVPDKDLIQANFCSQVVEVNENCNSLLIRFKNDNEPYYVMRFAATLSEQNYRKKQEVSTSSKGVNRKLLSIVDKTFVFRTDYLTRFTHDWIMKAMESDVLEIEIDGVWQRLIAEETYKVDYEAIPLPERGQGSITLVSYDYEYYNNWC